MPADWAPWIEIFAEHGIEGTVQEEDHLILGGYLYNDTDSNEHSILEETITKLGHALTEKGATKIERSIVEEIDWSESWKQFFKPTRIGQRFVICPTWETFESKPGDNVITLDPGQAFGTGDHPTTKMCLEFLENEQLVGKSFGDLGCGSGILTIGAAMLGAKPCFASDIDQASVESTQENFDRNGVNALAIAGKGFEPLQGHGPFDILISNIISATLIRLSSEAANYVKPGGIWIISGVIESNWPDVREAIEAAGFTYNSHLQEREWIAARFIR